MEKTFERTAMNAMVARGRKGPSLVGVNENSRHYRVRSAINVVFGAIADDTHLINVELK